MGAAPQDQQPGSASAADGAATDGPTVDSWCDKDQRIVVTQPAAGFLYDLVLRAKIEGDPSEVYRVLVDPHSHEIFRGIRATLARTTLEDDGAGRRKLLVAHRALTKFLWISVAFDTELYVWEDDVARTIRFTNARGDGFMKQFDGTWRVQPFTQATLDSIYRPGATQQQQHHGNWLGGILHAATGRLGGSRGEGGRPSAALVTLEQALAPKARPPGPVAHLVRGLCGRVLHNMMADLRAEVARRQQLEQQGSSGGSSAGPGERGGVLSHQQCAPSLPVGSLTLSSSCSGSGGKKAAASSVISRALGDDGPIEAAQGSDDPAWCAPLNIIIRL